MTDKDELKIKIDKMNSLQMDILNFNLNNQNQLCTDLQEFRNEININLIEYKKELDNLNQIVQNKQFNNFDDINNKINFLYVKLNQFDDKNNFDKITKYIDDKIILLQSQNNNKIILLQSQNNNKINQLLLDINEKINLIDNNFNQQKNSFEDLY